VNDDCVFCRIAAGQEPAHQIMEDDIVVAFLPLKPINPGHVLVIPRQHLPSIFDLDETTYSHLFLVAKHLATVVDGFAGAVRVGLVVAGYGVPGHAHVHIVPMRHDQDITSKSTLEDTLMTASDEELAAVASELRHLLQTAN
jgi:histidine triad (HIT) family protein